MPACRLSIHEKFIKFDWQAIAVRRYACRAPLSALPIRGAILLDNNDEIIYAYVEHKYVFIYTEIVLIEE